MSEPSATGAAGLTLSDNISVSWRAIDHRPDDAELAQVNEANESFLRAVSALATISTEDIEVDSGISQEIARLDIKVNLLLDLVSQLLYRQLEIPALSPVIMSSDEIEWRGEQLPEPGLTVFVQAYVQRGTPKPLGFYGEVVSTRQEYQRGCARVRYLGLSGAAQSWLDKLIFRHHRREVAYKRSQSSAAS